MIRIIKISTWLAAGLLLMLDAARIFAQKPAPPTGDVQVFRNALETVFVFPRVGPVDKKGELVAAADLTGQVRQALVNLRLMASRVGVSPAHVVTLTVYGTDRSLRDVMEKSVREA
ncbi:MAG: RidA family protein, partial [Candidatus Binatia bacterium]